MGGDVLNKENSTLLKTNLSVLFSIGEIPMQKTYSTSLKGQSLELYSLKSVHLVCWFG
jgi:hypothetical protein